MRGGAEAHLLECDDGRNYVVKFASNPQGGRRILVNEYICSLLMKTIGLHTPEIALVSVNRDFAAANPPMAFRGRPDQDPGLADEVHFGSRFTGDPTRTTVFDFLPAPMLAEVVNRHEFFGAMVFDQWVSNADGRQAVFYRAQIMGDVPGYPSVGWVAQFIDNGLAFQGKQWKLTDSPLHGIYPQRVVYGQRVSACDFYQWIDAIMSIDHNALFRVMLQLPQSWLQGQEAEIERVLKALLLRKERLPELVADALRRLQSLATRSIPNPPSAALSLPELLLTAPSN